MLTKSTQAGRYSRRKLRKVDKPEGDLQAFANEYLDIRRIRHIRIPDTMDGKAIRRALSGIPDNVLLLPIGQGYSLAVPVELKTKSKVHTSQRKWARDIPVTIAQTPDEFQSIVDSAVRMADKLRENFSEAAEG